jgi:hypothetical protein
MHPGKQTIILLPKKCKSSKSSNSRRMRSTSKNTIMVSIPKTKGNIRMIDIMMGTMGDSVDLAFKTEDFFTTLSILLLWLGVVPGVLEVVGA